jgi:NADH:ubiquinone reductase (H+-translocating)
MTRRTASTRRRSDPRTEIGMRANGDDGRPRVVVVGGGFAGLSTVRELSGADVDVLLQDRGGRIQVEKDMRVVGHPEIFAVGDIAASVDEALPQLAQPAIQGGRHAAAQIRRLIAGEPTEAMVYKDKRAMATIGRNAAVVQLPRAVRLRGRIAWLDWVALHIVTLVGHRNRLATLANLSVRYLAWPGRLNVIVGDPP